MRRDACLDLIKWLAMLTMVVDHLRYLWPQAESWLFFIGRLAFPLFCLVIAANVSRSHRGQLYTGGNARYLIWLAVFSVVSELPYHMLSTESSSMNIMPTLMLGLLIAWSVHHQGRDGLLLGVVSLAVAFMLHDRLMYGAFGVLLPAALIVAIQRPGPAWLLPAVLCVLANSRNRWIEVGDRACREQYRRGVHSLIHRLMVAAHAHYVAHLAGSALGLFLLPSPFARAVIAPPFALAP